MKVLPLNKRDFGWTKWRPGDFKEFPDRAITELKKDYAAIKGIKADARTFENTVLALERVGRKYGEKIGFAGFLAEVSPLKEVREAAHKMEEEYSQKIVDVVFDKDIYRALKEYAAKKEKLKGDKKILFDDMMRGYRRMGFDLPLKKQNTLKKNLKKLSELALSFRKNINDYNDHILITQKEAYGLSERYLSGLKKDSKERNIITLEYPDYIPFIENSPNDRKRKELIDKYSRKGGVGNLRILERMVALRHANARLLGYKSFAHYVIEERMAKRPETVMAFLHDIERRVGRKARVEKEEVLQLKRDLTKNQNATYEYYDGYYSNQLKKAKYSVDNEKIREYFPFERVREGVFATYQKLFGVKFERLRSYPLWHDDVELYAVKEKGKIISLFAMDLFPREGKYSHAMAVPLINGRLEKKGYQAPFSVLVCNFSKPRPGVASLLSHDEVETFFHEFGHVMHMVLSKARFESQSGASVAWDFVEAPSQMLENWAWDKEMLKRLSSHYQTGEQLPDDLIQKMLSAKKFMISSFYARQMLLAQYDMAVHLKKSAKALNEIYRRMMKEKIGFSLPKAQLFPAGFGHIGAGYAAGYYSYAWAQSIACDMYTRFEKEGLLNQKTGGDYRKWILEKGSSMEELELVKRFLGRKPNNKAFLKEIGALNK